MTNEQLIKAQEIKKLIEEAKCELKSIQEFSRFPNKIDVRGDLDSWIKISTEFIPFDVVKIICIQKHADKLNSLQAEFDAL